MKRLLLLLVVVGLIAGVGSASAVINDAEAWRAFDNDPGFINDSTGNGHTLTNNGATQVAGLLNESADFDGTADYMDDDGYNFGGAFTWSAWIKADDVSGGAIIDQSNGGFDNVLDLGAPASGDIRFALTGTTARVIIDSSTTPVTAGNWHHVVAWYDGGTMRIYVDNVEVASGAKTGSLDSTGYSDTQLGRQRTSNHFNGTIDEVGFYTRALSTAEIAELYNSGAGINPYSGVATEFLITAQDSYTTSSLTNFSATFSNGTTYTTTNGTINTGILSNSTSLYNITISSEEAGGYFNKTYNDYNVSSNLQASLTQSIVGFTATNKVSGASVTNFTVSTNSNGGSATNTTTNPTLYLTAANNYVGTFEKTGYYDKNITFNTTAATSTNEAFEVYNHKLNVSITVGAGSASTNNFTINIYDRDGYNYSDTVTTTSGNLIANLTHGNYTVWLNDSEHELVATNITLNNSVNFTNLVIDARTARSFDIEIRNETTNDLLSGINITVSFISDSESFNLTTNNGTVFVDLLTPDEYQIKYRPESTEETIRSYFVTLNNQSYEEITLYLIDESISTFYVARVVDDSSSPCQEQTVSMLRYYIDPAEYRIVQMARTDSQGQSVFRVRPNTVDYKFLFSGVCGSFESSPSKLIDSINTYTVFTAQNYLQGTQAVEDATTGLVYVNGTRTFSYSWSSTSNVITQGCLEITKRYQGVRSVASNQCSSGISGSVVYTIPSNETNETTWFARGYLETNTDYSTITTNTQEVSFISGFFDNAAYAPFAALIVFTAMILLFGTSAPSLLVGTVLSVLLMSTFYLISLSYATIATIIILAGVMLYRLRTN